MIVHKLRIDGNEPNPLLFHSFFQTRKENCAFKGCCFEIQSFENVSRSLAEDILEIVDLAKLIQSIGGFQLFDIFLRNIFLAFRQFYLGRHDQSADSAHSLFVEIIPQISRKLIQILPTIALISALICDDIYYCIIGEHRNYLIRGFLEERVALVGFVEWQLIMEGLFRPDYKYDRNEHNESGTNETRLTQEAIELDLEWYLGRVLFLFHEQRYLIKIIEVDQQPYSIVK